MDDKKILKFDPEKKGFELLELLEVCILSFKI